MVTAKTSGMAIASLILGLVWATGIGSLLAVIFAIVARKNIKDSRGRQTGEGLAIAGLVIGIIGLLGAVLFFVSVAAVNHGVNHLKQQIQSSESPTNVSMGTKVTVGDPGNTGITAVTVQSLTFPVVASNPEVPTADPGKEYSVAKIEVCAGRSGSQSGPDDLDFTLGFADGETAETSFFPIETPDIGKVNALGPNACATGYVSFEIASGTAPSYVAYQPGLIHQYRWKASG
jgi:hypothetical protein